MLEGLTMIMSASPPGGGSGLPAKSSHTPVTLTVWSFFTGSELTQLNSVLNGVTKKAPWITINSVKGKQPSDILQAINSGGDQVPDVAIEPGPDDSAKYCATGAWLNLNPYITADHINLSSLSPPAALRYTGYKGDQ